MLKNNLYGLTNPQKSIWVTEKFYNNCSINNICGTAIIKEKVDFEKLSESIKIVCKKHDNFMLEIKIVDGNIKQMLSKEQEIEPEFINIESQEELEKEREKIVRTTFNLENSKLFKFYIFKFKNGEGAFMLNIHHLISDAWTLALICNEIIKTYSNLKQHKKIETEPIYSYIDYINSEIEYQKSERFEKDKLYWEEKFKTIPEVASIPGSIKKDMDTNNPNGARKQYALEKSYVAKIKEYCKENKISLYNFFMAIYAIYIGEISNLNEFVIGTPILNRTNFKEKNTPGMFINTAPFKINLDENLKFKEFVKNIAIDSIRMLKHQKYSYQLLLENLRQKNSNIPNLYNILLSYQITNAMQTEENINYKTEWTFNGYCADDIDIHIYDINDTGNLNIAYDYKTSIYADLDIENVHKRILNIIEQILKKEDINVKDIEIVTPKEKYFLINELNKTELEYDEKVPIIKYFEEQAQLTPNNIAITFENKEMTYKELNEKANSLAYVLRENGVKNNSIVGILEDRSFEVMIAILAVLKSGGSYIPIATDYPSERIEYMLEDSNAEILLTEKENYVKTDKKIISIKLGNEFYNEHKNNIKNISKPDDLSYLIYTSGSTGTPKGVMQTQRTLSNFYAYNTKNLPFFNDAKNHKILSITTVSFDIFIFETVMALSRGLNVYLTNEIEQKSSILIEKIIKENKIEIMQATPSVMKVHLDNFDNLNNVKSIKYIMLSGEPLPIALRDKLISNFENVHIYNGYGPSETFYSNIVDVTNQKEITIGKPISNTHIYILNKNKKILPFGTIGEIYISGDCVGKGYMNKPKQTKNSFIKDPFVNGMRMYKVGDLGAYEKNHEIICYGRIDNQVKIRGLRIELDEIEKQLTALNNIKDAVVVKKTVSNKEALCAFLVEKEQIDEDKIRKYLRNKLPQYMIPQYFVKLEKMPHTPNGKIDRRSLPEPNIEELPKEIVKPRNEIDVELLKIVKKMMHLENISMTDTLLDLGGDSLTAITLSTKILSKFNVQIYVKNILTENNLMQISDLIKKYMDDNNTRIKIEKSPVKDFYPLSTAQKRIYYNSKMIGENNLVYNMPGGIFVDEILDKDKIKAVFDKIIERHETLRTAFVVHDENVVQVVSKKINFEIPVFNDKEEEKEQIIKKFVKPFDLSSGNLIRIEIHYLDKKETMILIDFHHIIMDGTSLKNLIIEFGRLYNGYNLKRIPIQYVDYSVWEEEYNNSEKIKRAEEYWINKFKGSELSSLNLPYDFKIGASRSYNGNKINKVIDIKEYRKIERYAKKIGLSPYMFFLATFFILLYKYTGQEEIILGSPIANRDINETKRMIGMFVNNIVVKANINSNSTFQEFADEIKKQILDDLSHQPYPFDRLVKKLGIKGDNSRNPLFDVMFTYQNNEEHIIKLDEKEIEIVEINNNISKFNLSMEIKPKTHTINLEYCTDLFKKSTINRLFEHYMNTIHSILDNNEIKIKDIEIISKSEKNKIVYEFNDTYLEYDKNKTISQLFEEQVLKVTNKIAVVCNNRTLTYDELNQKANQVANYLKKRGIQPNDVVGVMYPRCIELIVVLLGVMKSGAAYIPIDPGYPKKRIEYMLQNSNAKILIINQELFSKIDFSEKICADFENLEILVQDKENIENINNSDDLAYLIYTSGSTGMPKGVQIMHKNLTNFIIGTKKIIDFNNSKNLVSVTTICFDIFGLEIWGTLSSGMTLVLATEEEQNIPSKLNTLCVKNNVNMIQTTPSRYGILLEDNNLEFLHNMTDIMVGGEPLTDRILNKLRENTNGKIYNMYGPTETTIWSTIKNETEEKNITIGKPIANTQCYILNENMQVVPIGVAGELYIAGDGVGLGYKDREKITLERFLKNPFIENSKMYKTGDVCFYTDSGEIVCLGRIDNQIKIRGLRIELDEIEKTMLKYINIKEAKVVKQTIGNREIISAYYISNKRIKISELRKYLNKYLPKYMIPSYFTAMDKLPYTPNGKIDKNALPIPDGILQNEKKEYIAPKSDLEIKLVSIWEDILNTKPIGLKDNFFELGGDSILAMNLNIKLLNITDKIKYSDIFAYPTITELAEKIQSDLKENDDKNLYELNEKYKYIFEENMTTPSQLKVNTENNILLTGGTGFLGIHILEEFLNKETGKIYIIIRKDAGSTVREKLLNKMHYYFEEKYDKFMENRIFAIQGDITKSGFGLNQKELFDIANSINVIVNSAAKVSHYGNYQDFYNINVKSVEKIVEFAKAFNKKIFHISTLSISGNAFMNDKLVQQEFDKEIIFNENKFFIGQKLDNVYVRSKFEAEKIILDSILNGVDAYILRMGNLMPRYKDGKFQDNISENAYIERLKSFEELGCIPEYLMKTYLEFTPIDYTAKAIMKIIESTNNKNRIYHLFNHNHVYIEILLKIINQFEDIIKIVSEEEFKRKIKNIIKSSDSQKIAHLINDLDNELNLSYDSKIKIDSNHSIRLLDVYGFKWPNIDKRYLNNIQKLIKGEIKKDES